MVWVGQVTVGRLSDGILLNIANVPSKYLLQDSRSNCFPKSGKLTPTPWHDKNTLELANLWSSHEICFAMTPLICTYLGSTSCGLSKFLHWSVEIGRKNKIRKK